MHDSFSCCCCCFIFNLGVGLGWLGQSCLYQLLEFEGVRKEITISGTKKGLGIRIVGGRTVQTSDNESYFGIFVKEVIHGSLAEKDGN